MNYAILDVVVIGLIAISIALLVLFGMVNKELGAVARLQGKSRFLLIFSLGSGVMAFSAKLLIITGLVTVSLPSTTHPPSAPKRAQAIPTKPPYFRLVELEDSHNISTHEDLNNVNYTWQALPKTAPFPKHNPTTAEKVILGEKLFFDPILSIDQSISCASCHDLYNLAGGDDKSTATGVHNQTGTRNSPTVWNAAFQSFLFWDGRAQSLEEQAKGPLLNPVEMGMTSFTAIENRINNKPIYQQLFAKAFGQIERININHIVKAIAAFERTLVTNDTPYDRFINGDLNALSQQQLKGMSLFKDFGCVNCHHGANFSAASVFDNSAPLRVFPTIATPIENHFDVFENNQRSAWRVPSLRNVALTGPWLHNGSVTQLEDMVRIMASAQLGWSGHYLLWSKHNQTIEEINRPMPTEQQIKDIVAFLHALSSDKLLRKTNNVHAKF